MKNMKRTNQKGFTLIELMIVIAIIGILASIALPAYQTYMKKAKFSEVVLATSDIKTAVELCAQDQGALTECNSSDDGGSNFGIKGVNASSEAIDKGAKTATVTSTGGTATAIVLTATGVGASGTAINGLEGETYVVNGTFIDGKMVWEVDKTNSTCKAVSIC